jgi:hypothetical protein
MRDLDFSGSIRTIVRACIVMGAGVSGIVYFFLSRILVRFPEPFGYIAAVMTVLLGMASALALPRIGNSFARFGFFIGWVIIVSAVVCGLIPLCAGFIPGTSNMTVSLIRSLVFAAIYSICTAPLAVFVHIVDRKTIEYSGFIGSLGRDSRESGYLVRIDSAIISGALHLDMKNIQFWCDVLLVMMLVILPVTIARGNEGIFVISVCAVMVAAGSALAVMTLRKLDSILAWSVMGYFTAQKTVVRWGRLIMGMLACVSLIAVCIPWRYQIVSERYFRNFVNMFVPEFRNRPGTADPGIFGANAVTGAGNSHGSDEINFDLFYGLGFIALIIAAYLLFFISTGCVGYFIQRFWRGTRDGMIVRFFIGRYEKMIEAADVIGDIISSIAEWVRRIFRAKEKADDSQDISARIYSFFGGMDTLSEEKKKEVRTIVAQFIRLVNVLERMFIRFNAYDGPLEYIQRVNGIIPQHSGMLLDIVGIFNESRYSLHLLPEQMVVRYKTMIDDAIAVVSREKPVMDKMKID